MNPRPLNVIFVLTDDQGYGDLGCHGNPVLKTPNLDAFHEQSTRFTNFHVGPTCAPTRSGLFTGHYANSTGVWHTVGGRSLLRDDEVSLADVFSERGYRTALFGKWHLGDNAPYRPQDRGFPTRGLPRRRRYLASSRPLGQRLLRRPLFGERHADGIQRLLHRRVLR